MYSDTKFINVPSKVHHICTFFTFTFNYAPLNSINIHTKYSKDVPLMLSLQQQGKVHFVLIRVWEIGKMSNTFHVLCFVRLCLQFIFNPDRTLQYCGQDLGFDHTKFEAPSAENM